MGKRILTLTALIVIFLGAEFPLQAQNNINVWVDIPSQFLWNNGGIMKIRQGEPFYLEIMWNYTSPPSDSLLGGGFDLKIYSPDLASITKIAATAGADEAVLPAPYNNVILKNGFQNNTYWNIFGQPSDWPYAFLITDFDGALPDYFGHAFASILGMPGTLGPTAFYEIHYQINQRGTFCVDSVFLDDPSFDWAFGNDRGQDVPAVALNRPWCWEVADPNASVIDVVPDSLEFSAIFGGSVPPAQVLQILNTGGGTLSWSATKKSSWLSIAPSFGVAPSNMQVLTNSLGLPLGTYYDTIVVSASSALNSPVSVPVRLRVTPPPPTISLSQDEFFFSAIVDSTNPPDQILTVSNSGQGTLNWTAANLSSWLTLNPTSGANTGDITLSVDITGLDYGLYIDTVVVSDPNAINTPQIAVVRLEIASGLPVLAIDSPFIFVIVVVGTLTPPDKSFYIYNEGDGTMDFQVVENSPRILSITPSSGTAPQTCVASFKIATGTPGTDIIDTVWVSSPQAINSPIPVYFQFHFVEDPAEIVLSRDSVTASYYECAQGIGDPPPPSTFSVFNNGTDPLNFTLNWKSSWLKPNRTAGLAPQQIVLNYDLEDLPVGTYYDTIVVSALNAINSPVRLPVKLTIRPTDTAPTIYAYGDTIFLAAQENRPGTAFTIEVNNINPGCMSWQLIENIDWLYYSIDSVLLGDYPWFVKFTPFANGLTMGTYTGQGTISAPGATNSPYPLNFKLRVWKLFGDVNYDGKINMLDVTYLIKFIYKGGPAPIPEAIVGDCDCNTKFNIQDLIALIDYLFVSRDPLCGNPY